MLKMILNQLVFPHYLHISSNLPTLLHTPHHLLHIPPSLLPPTLATPILPVRE